MTLITMSNKPNRPKVNFAFEVLDAFKQSARRPTLAQYRPHGKQVEFHSAATVGRFFLGGNRSGKTVGGAVEVIHHLKGEHPFQKLPWSGPLRGRGVAVDIEDGLKKIMLPEIAKWIPRSLLINGSWEDSYDKQSRILTCANDSMMDFLTYEQDTEKHAGTSRHFVWFDEEPPKNIFDENMLRLVDVGGHYWITMTPLLGLTWIYNDYVLPIMIEGVNNPNVTIIEVHTDDNPHINLQVLEVLLQGMSQEDKDARRKGKFLAHAGLIYPNFDEEKHVIPPLRYEDIHYPIVAGMDHGTRNPTAWVFGFVDGDGVLTIFHVHYATGWRVDEHAEYVHNFCAENNLDLYYVVGDPAITQVSGITNTSVHSTYAECGVSIVLGNNAVNHGIDRVKYYLDHGLLRVTEDCKPLIREFREYRWSKQNKKNLNDPRETPTKTNDHALDALRYLVVSRPENDTGLEPIPLDARALVGTISTTLRDSDDLSAEDWEDAGTGTHHPILGNLY